MNRNCAYCDKPLTDGEMAALNEYIAEFGDDGEAAMCDACAEGDGDSQVVESVMVQTG